LPLHHAVRVAEEYAMLDVLSGGRVDLGIGRGFSRHEFASLGISMESRDGRFAEGVSVLLEAWTRERFSFKGDHYVLSDVEVLPRPLQQPHPPIWLAASVNRARFNVMLNPYSREVDEVRRGLDWYREALVQAGHDVAGKRIMVNYHLYTARDELAARDEPREALLHYLSAVDRSILRGDDSGRTALLQPSYDAMYPGRVMFGTPDAIESKIRAWMRFGVTDFCFMSLFGNLDPARSLASIRLFSEEVMPRFKR
jgi:alkanesulfonate monooxygenase SsuD/methylene tetrahydromethanopterin reductase-like flavin-dependent oxidoreductase (luciferase family)